LQTSKDFDDIEWILDQWPHKLKAWDLLKSRAGLGRVSFTSQVGHRQVLVSPGKSLVGSRQVLSRSQSSSDQVLGWSRSVLVKSWVGLGQVPNRSRDLPINLEFIYICDFPYALNTVKCFTGNHFSRNYFLSKIFSNENHFTSKKMESSLINAKCHLIVGWNTFKLTWRKFESKNKSI
jgi:hypothetical protein